MSRLGRLAEFAWLLGLALAAVTGLFVLGTGIFAPGYFTVLQVHVGAGVVGLIATVPGLLSHFRRHPEGRARTALLGAAGLLFVVGVALRSVPWVEDVGPNEVGRMVHATALATLAVGALGWSLLGRGRHGGHWSGSALVVASCLALLTGYAAWQVRGDSRVPAEIAHTFTGIAAVLALAPHLRLLRRWIRGEGHRGLLTAAVVVVVGIAVWGWALFAKVLTPTDGRRIAEEARVIYVGGDPFADVPASTRSLPEASLDSRSCGEAGCHQELADQWRGSAHRFAVDNRLYRMSVAELVAERGAAEVVFCARCHDPDRVLAGTVERDYAGGDPPPSDGVSCIACHSSLPPPDEVRPVNGAFAYRQPLVYPGADPATRNRNIRLDPRAHRASFNVLGHSQGESGCLSCHQLQLGPHMGAAVDAFVQTARADEDPGVACNHCHMPNTTPPPGDEGSVLWIRSPPQYDHELVGMNQDLPLYTVHVGDDADALIAVADVAGRFARGEVRPFPEDDAGLEESDYGQALLAATQGPVLDVAVEATATADGIALVVTSRNLRAGHPFPIGPFDLQQVWQEVVVRDAEGRQWAHLGGLDGDGRIEGAPARLGATERQRDGRELLRHRIWDVVAVEDKRQIEAQGQVVDRYAVPLPAEAPRELTVEVGWNVRRLSPRLADEAFPGEGFRLPVRRVGAATVTVTRPARGSSGPDTGGP